MTIPTMMNPAEVPAELAERLGVWLHNDAREQDLEVHPGGVGFYADQARSLLADCWELLAEAVQAEGSQHVFVCQVGEW